MYKRDNIKVIKYCTSMKEGDNIECVVYSASRRQVIFLLFAKKIKTKN